jgi:hypothetical protein
MTSFARQSSLSQSLHILSESFYACGGGGGFTTN